MDTMDSELRFKDINELKDRMMPVLRMRVKELKDNGALVDCDMLWEYFVGIWSNETNLTLSDLVEDVLNREIR